MPDRRFRPREHLRLASEFRRVYDRKRSVSDERLIVSAVYLALGAAILLKDRHHIGRLFRRGLATPYATLTEGP